MASKRLSPHIWRLLDEALAQRREDVVQERAQDILAIELENSEGGGHSTFLENPAKFDQIVREVIS